MEAGKRDDKVGWNRPDVWMDKEGRTTTKKSKQKMYRPVKQDKRRTDGPRKRQMTALGSHEIARMPSRQVRMNLPVGAKELLGLGKGIFENKTTNYEKEEKEIFEVKDDIKKIFEDLEQI